MPQAPNQVFTRDDYNALRDAQKDLNMASQIMDKAEKCGIECQALREIKDQLLDFLVSVEREFMTPPPQERRM